MKIVQIFTNNSYRNFNYLIGCEETGEAIAIDPLAYQMCLKEAKKRNWSIVAIVNTHEHLDHIGGNNNLILKTDAKLYAHKEAKHSIPNIDFGMTAGDVIKVGKTVELEVLDTPGHTMSHICLLSQGNKKALFSGDTLFNAGAGNCHNGGDPEVLYETFHKKIFNLDQETLVYPGHEYLENNLLFSLNTEPNNLDAKNLLKNIREKKLLNTEIVTNLSLEFKVNSFFRLKEEEVILNLQKKGELSSSTKPKEVFLALRRLRNNW